eukprot:CAMPEP_0175127158 /NCGR_PEP_ID=MMETSP0087-20121206/4243_1 /TAXON_ID=136419 /ORGANISM="Unknown Unknown, Strain D1" /LENGTH=106 /DNA_ID=CAMNT_0016409129 /DNA_START=47 /DNA_END=364 /DNA_ORIENTATION=+
MGGSAHLNFTAGGLVLGGGIAGYVKAKSIPSLVAGVAIGAAYLASGYTIQNGDDKKGHAMGLATSLVLVGATGPRAMRTKKFIPGGLMATIGTACGVYNAKKTYEW